MQVKYIGNHVKVDSIPGVGLSWEPGQERDVTSTVAAHLLAYPDTWIKGDEGSDPSGDKTEPIDFHEKDKRPEEPVAVVNFHAMNKKDLIKYAEDNWHERFDKRTSESVIRERVIKRHQAEQA